MSTVFDSRISKMVEARRQLRVVKMFSFGWKIWRIAKDTGLSEEEVKRILVDRGVDQLRIVSWQDKKEQ